MRRAIALSLGNPPGPIEIKDALRAMVGDEATGPDGLIAELLALGLVMEPSHVPHHSRVILR